MSEGALVNRSPNEPEGPANRGVKRSMGGSPRGVCRLWFACTPRCRFASGTPHAASRWRTAPGGFPPCSLIGHGTEQVKRPPAELEPADL